MVKITQDIRLGPSLTSYFFSPSFSKPASYSSIPLFCNSRTPDFLIHSSVLYLSHYLKDVPQL